MFAISRAVLILAACVSFAFAGEWTYYDWLYGWIRVEWPEEEVKKDRALYFGLDKERELKANALMLDYRTEQFVFFYTWEKRDTNR